MTLGLPGQNTARAFPTAEDLDAAAAGALPRVEQGNEPAGSAFFSWQNPWWPPFPAPFLDGVDEWDLGNGDILVDDRFVSYEILAQANELQLWGSESGPLEANGVGAGCGLFLSISFSNATTFVLTLHNTRHGQTYSIWSTTNLTLGQFTTNWVLETNVLGASGDFTEARLSKKWTALTCS